jgi:Inner membrane protein CreD
MSGLRLLSVVGVFCLASLAWVVLGAVTTERTQALDRVLATEMSSLWGPRVFAQASPWWAPSPEAGREQEGTLAPAASEIRADLDHEHRYKGLLWYSTFAVDFTATYRFEPEDGSSGAVVFPLPEDVRTYQDLRTEVDGTPQAVTTADIAAGRLVIPIEGGETPRTVTVHYRSGGRDAWLYCVGDAPSVTFPDGVPVVAADGRLSEARDLDLVVTTSFTEIDYPRGALSPAQRARPEGPGMKAVWAYPRLISSQAIGVVMPARPNAGPIVARMSFFAPVSLLFFFTVLFTLMVLKRIPLHPMHYLFVSAGFFSFHILLAYLADLMDLQLAFGVCAAISVALVVSYMRLAAGVRFAVTWVALAQLVYLVGFSYAFFWESRTGLTVVIGAILTLFLLMQATGRIDWSVALSAERRPDPTPETLPGLPHA